MKELLSTLDAIVMGQHTEPKYRMHELGFI